MKIGLTGSLRSFRKSEFLTVLVFKVDYFILPLFLVPKLRSVYKMNGKTPMNIFFTFGSKINEFERKNQKKK